MIRHKMAIIFLLYLFHLCKFCHSATPLIPRKEFLSTSDYSGVTMSHDGKYLAYISPNNMEPELSGSRNLYVKQLPNGQPRRLTNDKTDSILVAKFAYDNKTILYMSDPDGDENFAIYTVNLNTGKIAVIDDDEQVQAWIVAVRPTRPTDLIYKINKRNPVYHDFYSYNIESGEKKLVFQNDLYVDVMFNYDLQPVVAYNQTDNAGQTFYRLAPNGQTELIKESPPEARDSTKPITIDATGTSYWFDNDFADKVELVAIDPTGKFRRVLYSPKKADVDNVKFHPLTGRPLWAYENYMKSQVVHFDDSFKPDFACLKQRLPRDAQISLQDASLDMKTWLVSVELDSAPSAYYMYNRINKTVTFLLSTKEKLAKQKISSTYPFDVRTSDGLTEVCYVVLPVDFDQSKNGIPTEPLPTVIFVHGGPHARDYWVYELYPQYLANRNYAVIRCNYRASTGYGKAFLNAGNGEWGKKMQQDLTDAVNWAIEQKISNPKKVAIAGYSYGGYATLAGLTFTPDLYSCGVDIVGPSNLVTLLQTIPSYWKPALEGFKLSMGGDPDTDDGKEKLRQSSPFNFVDRIKKPLLIGQGANDPRVNQAESDQIFEAMKNSNVPVTYMLFSNEGHGFKHQENDMAFWSIAEKFLADCLGGRFEPTTDEVEKSTATIKSYNSNSNP